MMTLAHGAGAGMNHSFMTTLAASLSEVGIATLRFKFPIRRAQKRKAGYPCCSTSNYRSGYHERS